MTKDQFEKALCRVLSKNGITDKLSEDEIEEAAQEITEGLSDDLGDDFIEMFDSEEVDDDEEVDDEDFDTNSDEV